MSKMTIVFAAAVLFMVGAFYLPPAHSGELVVRINGEEVEVAAINIRIKEPTPEEVFVPKTPTYDFYDYDKDGVIDFGVKGCEYDPFNPPYSEPCYTD